MKSKLFILLISSAILLGAGCQTSPEIKTDAAQNNTSTSTTTPTEKRFTHFESKEQNFAIDYPKEWSQTEEDNIVMFSPEDSTSLNVTTQKTKETLDEISKRVISDYKKDSKNFKVIEEKNITVSDKPAKKIVYEYIYEYDGGSLNLRMTQIFVLKDGTEYIISYLNRQEKPTANLDIFEKMVNSFRIL